MDKFFLQKEADMLSYIKNKELINKQKLQGFLRETEELLAEYTKMPKQRAEKILLSAACEIVERIQPAREYGKRANCTISVKEPIRENKLKK